MSARFNRREITGKDAGPHMFGSRNTRCFETSAPVTALGAGRQWRALYCNEREQSKRK